MLHDERELLFLILVGETCSLRASCGKVRSSAMLRNFFFFFFPYLMLDDLIDVRLDFMHGMEKKKKRMGKRLSEG